MSTEIMEKLLEHDHHFERIDDHLKGIDKRFIDVDIHLRDVDKHLDGHDQRLDKLQQTLDQHTVQLDLLSITVVEHTERLDRIERTMATKVDIAKLSAGMDELIGLARKKDQELVFLGERVDRIEKKLELEPIL